MDSMCTQNPVHLEHVNNLCWGGLAASFTGHSRILSCSRATAARQNLEMQLVGWVRLVRVAGREGLFAASGVGPSCESGQEGGVVCS